MPDTNPTDTAAPTWFTRNRAYVVLAMMLLGWLTSAIQAVRNGQPVPPPPVTQVPAPFVGEQPDVPINYEGARYHGTEAHGLAHIEASGRPWPTKNITYWVDYSTVPQLRPALSNDMVSAAFKQAWNWWAEGLDIEPQEVTDPSAALVTIRFEKMDGPNGVLAESYLADGTLNPKTQRYDSSERWTVGPPASGLLSLPTVACHEIGHVLGLGHDDPTAPAVMRPVYSASLPREQARDYSRMIALGYKKRIAAPTGPVDVLSFPVQAKTTDVIDSLKKAGFTVTKP